MALNSPHCHRIYFTDVLAEFKCDTFLPEFDSQRFKEIESDEVEGDTKNEGGVQYKFRVFEKIAGGELDSDLFNFATPDISHFSGEDYFHVYEPAEDTFLFLDAMQSDCKFLKGRHPRLCLEIGSGSGVVSTFAAQMLGSDTYFVCTDINRKAAEATSKTGMQNHIVLNVVLGDLAGALLPRLQGQVDLLLFNPPYVVTPSEEVGTRGIEASWAGGPDGRQVTNRFLPQVPQLLSDTGVFYLVVIKENKPDEIQRYLEKAGLHMTTVLSRRSGPEFLSVLRFVRHLSPVLFSSK